VLLSSDPTPASAKDAKAARGRAVFDQVCAACHLGGIGGAPSISDTENWRRRMQQGEAVLVGHALEGFRAMPARGGNAGLTDAEVMAAVKYMTSKARR
jgi:cytochrome c5